MKSQIETPIHPAAFEVRYRFLSAPEGGRELPPHQGLRCDFLYEGDDPLVDGLHMIHPRFINDLGDPVVDGPVPEQGRAAMVILNPNPDRALYHKSRLSIGVQGYFMEGPRKIAVCEVTALLDFGLADARRPRTEKMDQLIAMVNGSSRFSFEAVAESVRAALENVKRPS